MNGTAGSRLPVRKRDLILPARPQVQRLNYFNGRAFFFSSFAHARLSFNYLREKKLESTNVHKLITELVSDSGTRRWMWIVAGGAVFVLCCLCCGWAAAKERCRPEVDSQKPTGPSQLERERTGGLVSHQLVIGPNRTPCWQLCCTGHHQNNHICPRWWHWLVLQLFCNSLNIFFLLYKLTPELSTTVATATTTITATATTTTTATFPRP